MTWLLFDISHVERHEGAGFVGGECAAAAPPDRRCGSACLSATVPATKRLGCSPSYFANIITYGNNPHAYSMRIDFGHQDNNDLKTFTPYASHIVPAVNCAAHQTTALHAAGAADPNLQLHFSDIKAIRPVFILEDSGLVLGFGGC